MNIYAGLLLCICSFFTVHAQPQGSPLQTKIIKNKGEFRLQVNGKPFFIKGAVGNDHLEKLKQCGGNAIRTGSTISTLNKAHSLGLAALVNLPVKAERDGMDYEDTAAVRAQHEAVMSIVQKTQKHPAVLMWALGNELDFIQANIKERYNLKVWDAVNALAKAIHKMDPNHLVLTVVGSIDKGKIQDLLLKCPDLDILGVNEYGDLIKVPGWLQQFGWRKPYVVTEWGPTGFWQVPKTDWKAPIEETSSMKADNYKLRYEKAISADENCLGAFVFLWRQHQERTHTWFGMFDAEGLSTEAVDVMEYEWTGKWPSYRAPRLDSVSLNSTTAYKNVYLQKNKIYSAQVWATDADADSLRYNWEVLPEGEHFPYGGNGESKPAALPSLIQETNTERIHFSSPGKEGAYRLFVYVYDGKRHWATANIPFYVRP